MTQLVLSTLPSLVLGVLVVGGVVLLSLAGLWAVHRAVPREVRETHNDIAGFIYAIVGVIYAVMLALVVIAVWEQFDEARLISEREANAVADLYRGAFGFGEAERDRLRGGLESYTRAVVDDEWRLLARGLSSQRAWETLDATWAAYLALEPRSEREKAVYAEALTQLNALGDARRERLLASRSTVPLVLWAALIMGGAITIAFSYFFGTSNTRAHTLMTAGLAGVIGLGLYVVLAMDAPYSGGVAVSSEAFEQTLETFERLGRR